MSKYELDDDLVRKVVSGLTSADNQDLLFAQLEQQLPVPVKLGAVVRTDEGIAVLADLGASAPWVLTKPGGDYSWRANIGRITEVLAAGVDL